MSTRSILALQKGNTVRYCFLHWDGENHGKTLKEMLDSEIEELFDAMAPIEKKNGVHVDMYLDHLHSKSYWDAYIAAYKIGWKRQHRSLKNFDECVIGRQTIPYLPIVLEPVKKLDRTETGAYKTERQAPSNVNEALNGFGPFPGCEYVWFYNLDTRVITYFHCSSATNYEWVKKLMKRRKRLTPVKYGLADFKYLL